MAVFGRRLQRGVRTLGGPFGRGQGLHRERVDFLAHALAQGGVHPLMAAHTRQAFELGRDDGGVEVLAIALHVQVIAAETGGNVRVELSGGRIGHDAPIIADKHPPPSPRAQFRIL